MASLFLRPWRGGWLFIASLSVVAASAQAQNPSPLVLPPSPARADAPTLQEAVARALARNPDLAVVQREWEATRGAAVQAGLRPNPELSYLEEDFRGSARTRTLQIAQPFELGAKREARMAVAELLSQQARADIWQARVNVRAATVTSYFDTVVAQERLRLARESLGIAATGTDAAARRVLAGKVSPVEESRARVAQAAAQAELVQAQGALRTSRQRLSALWGESAATFGELPAPVQPPAEELRDETVRSQLQASPALQRARLELQRWQSSVSLERSRRTPDITLTLGAKRPGDGSAGAQAVVGVSVPLPVFNRNQGHLAEALSREDKARDELAATEIRLTSAVAQTRELLTSARAELQTLQQDALPGARLAYQAAFQGFALGKFSYLETLDAQRTLVATQTQYLRALLESYRLGAELERQLGLPDLSDLSGGALRADPGPD